MQEADKDFAIRRMAIEYALVAFETDPYSWQIEDYIQTMYQFLLGAFDNNEDGGDGEEAPVAQESTIIPFREAPKVARAR